MPIRITALALSTALIATSAAAQTPAPGTITTDATLSGIVQFDTDLDRGGDFHWWGAIASGSVTRQFTPEFAAGLSLRYGYEEWSFSGSNVAFGGKAPWSNIARPTIGATFSYAVTPDVILGLVPSFGWAYDTGASASDGQVYGALLTATKVFSPNLVLGIGAGVYREIDKTSAFPFLVINWKIDEHWRVSNPFPAGPAGGAGLELVYGFDNGWELAGGGTYRNSRFRLASDGPYPDGIGETRYYPAFGRLTYRFSPATRLDFYAGALLGGKLTVKDSGGNDITNDEFKAAPVIGMTLASRF
jgi:hypothetical protein